MEVRRVFTASNGITGDFFMEQLIVWLVYGQKERVISSAVKN